MERESYVKKIGSVMETIKIMEDEGNAMEQYKPTHAGTPIEGIRTGDTGLGDNDKEMVTHNVTLDEAVVQGELEEDPVNLDKVNEAKKTILINREKEDMMSWRYLNGDMGNKTRKGKMDLLGAQKTHMQTYMISWPWQTDQEKVVHPSNLVASRILGWQ